MGIKKNYNRRKFLQTAGCAALGSTTFFSTLFNLQSLSAASILNLENSSGGDEYRALVCIMLGGGNDSYNMLAPVDAQHYQEYKSTRSNLAIAKDDLLKLEPNTFNEKELGLHPAMEEIKTLFDEGKVAFINNVGTLVQPTSKSQYFSGADLPFGLFSHSDQDKQWLTSVPQTNSPTGWAGRMADILQFANSNPDISMNISLSGKNIFQLGQQTAEYSILPSGNGSIGINAYDGITAFDSIRTEAVKSLLEKQYQDVFRKSYAEVVTASQNTHELFSSAVGDSRLFTLFGLSNLAQSLKMVARTMKVREALGVKRQTFFIRVDGWDHHDELTNSHTEMLRNLSQAVAQFQKALAEIELEDCVTTFTVSDFARTLVSNGNGTDHAWGGNVMVLGNQVKGKEIYGSYPSLALNGPLMLEGGVLIPQISTDEYFAELALWFGAARTDLTTLFPNIGNFYDVMSSEMPLGFMET